MIFVLDDVAEVLGEEPGTLLRPLQEIMSTRIVVAAGTALAFRDATIHAEVYARIPEPIRLALHRQIGTRLLERASSAVPAARHLARGARPGDAAALAALDRATQEVLASAPSAAAEFARRALDLTAPDDRLRFERGMIAVDALVAADRHDDAATLARGLIDEGPPARFAFDLHLRLSSILVLSGDAAGAVDEAEAVVREPGLATTCYAAAESAHLLALLATGDLGPARRSAEAILAGESPHQGDVALASALAVLSMTAWKAGHLAEALSLMRGAVGRGDSGACAGQRAFMRLALGRMQMATGEPVSVDPLSRERSDESPAWSIALSILRARVLVAHGKLDDAVAETEHALARAEELRTQFLLPMVRSTIAGIALLRGEADRASTQIETGAIEPHAIEPDAIEPYACSAGPVENRLPWIRARVLRATVGRREAFASLTPVYRDITSYFPTLLEEPGSAAWLVRIALAEGDRASATSVASAAEKLAADNLQFVCISAIALHTRGLFDRDADLLQQAAATHWQSWARASAAEDAGVVLAELGRGDESRGQLACALSDYMLAGSEGDASRVRNRLRANRCERRTRVSRPLEGWDSLTDGERRVVSLVVQGLTNRQAAERAFLSRHTVDFHLRQAFRKLNITSRVELVRLAVEQERKAG